MTPRRVVALIVLCGVAFVAAGMPPASAEVSATTDESGRAKVVVALLGITEDGEPVPNWTEQTNQAPERRVLNPGGAANGDGPPSILLNPLTRIPIVAWPRASETGFDVVVSQFINGEWTAPLVLADEVGDALDPQLVADRTTGAVHLVYWVNDESPRVMHRSAVADLSGWNEAVLVSQPFEHAARATAVVHGGRLVVAYESHPGTFGATPRQIIVAERIDGVWLSQTLAGSTFDGANAPRIHSAPGQLWVDWFDGSSVMRWSSRQNTQPWTPLGVEGFTDFEDQEFHVRGRVRATVRALAEE